MTDALAVISLVIDALALAAPVGAAVYARRSAVAADRSATAAEQQAIETRRQADVLQTELDAAQTPQLTMQLQDRSPQDWYYSVHKGGRLDWSR